MQTEKKKKIAFSILLSYLYQKSTDIKEAVQSMKKGFQNWNVSI